MIRPGGTFTNADLNYGLLTSLDGQSWTMIEGPGQSMGTIGDFAIAGGRGVVIGYDNINGGDGFSQSVWLLDLAALR